MRGTCDTMCSTTTATATPTRHDDAPATPHIVRCSCTCHIAAPPTRTHPSLRLLPACTHCRASYLHAPIAAPPTHTCLSPHLLPACAHRHTSYLHVPVAAPPTRTHPLPHLLPACARCCASYLHAPITAPLAATCAMSHPPHGCTYCVPCPSWLHTPHRHAPCASLPHACTFSFFLFFLLIHDNMQHNHHDCNHHTMQPDDSACNTMCSAKAVTMTLMWCDSSTRNTTCGAMTATATATATPHTCNDGIRDITHSTKTATATTCLFAPLPTMLLGLHLWASQSPRFHKHSLSPLQCSHSSLPCPHNFPTNSRGAQTSIPGPGDT